jgi:hypothetical protein
VFILYSSCEKDNYNCGYDLSKHTNRYLNRILPTHRTKGKIDEYRDVGRDTLRSGYYVFFPNNTLKEYYFFASMDTYVYQEEYDVNNNLIKTVGVPLVYKNIKLDSSDFITVKIYFFSLHKQYGKLKVIDEIGENYLSLEEDTIYTNMKFAHFKIDCSKYQREKIIRYLQIEYKNNCSEEITRINDTINLLYNKTLSAGACINLCDN